MLIAFQTSASSQCFLDMGQDVKYFSRVYSISKSEVPWLNFFLLNFYFSHIFIFVSLQKSKILNGHHSHINCWFVEVPVRFTDDCS